MADTLIWGPLKWNLLIDLAKFIDYKNLSLQSSNKNLTIVDSLQIFENPLFAENLDYLNMFLEKNNNNDSKKSKNSGEQQQQQEYKMTYGDYKNTMLILKKKDYEYDDINNRREVLVKDNTLYYHSDNLNEIFKNLLESLKSLLFCIWCRIHFRKFMFDNEKYVKIFLNLCNNSDNNIINNDAEKKKFVKDFWLRLIFKMKDNVNKLNNVNNGIDFFNLELKTDVLTSLGNPEQFWDLIIVFSLHYPKYACDNNRQPTMFEIDEKIKQTLIKENDYKHVYCETQDSIKQSFIKFLECNHMLFTKMPVYETLVGFFWPPPLYCQTNNELMSNWLISRQYVWYDKYRSVQILLNKLYINKEMVEQENITEYEITMTYINAIKNVYKKIVIE